MFIEIPARILLFLLLAVSFPLNVSAETEDTAVPGDSANSKVSPLNISLELSTKYVWRGIEYGKGPTTFGKLTYQNKFFDAYLEGIYEVNGSHSEVDMGIGCTYKWLYVGLSDYYYPSSVGENDKYFKLSSRKTGHCVEAYTILSPDKIPLQLTLSCYMYGADKNVNGNQAFSSYAELLYAHSFKNDNVLSLALGAGLNKGFYTDYQHGFNIVNVALKYETNFKIGSYNLPVSASYIVNPYREKAFFTLSVFFKSKL